MQGDVNSESAETIRDEIENARLNLANAFLSDGLDGSQRDLATAVLGLLSINSRLATIVTDLSAQVEHLERQNPLRSPKLVASEPGPEWLVSDLEAA